MDKERIKGKVKDISGRVERQAGEWTGNEKMQGEGALKQGEGKIRQGIGKVKDAGRKAVEDIKDRSHDEGMEHDVEHRDRDRKIA